MEEQKYIVENQEAFELEDIFECGQCFRWNRQEDGSYTGVAKDTVMNVKKEGKQVVFTGVSKSEDFQKLVRSYFDLETDYEKLKKKLAEVDENLAIATKFGKRNSYFKSRFMGMYDFFYYFCKQQYS